MSKKFTGITSAGSAIPVYDKDAHEALSSKLDTTAFSSVSGEFATVDDVVAAVSGKADTSAIPSLDGYATQEWVGEQGYLTEVPEGYATTEDVISATSGLQPSGDYASAADLVNYQPVSAMTGFQAAGDYYSASNPSGFLIADDITGKMDVTAMTAYQPAGDYQPSGDYLSASESANFYPMTGNPSGFLTEHQSLDGLMQTSGLEYDGDKISGYMGSAFAGGGEVPEGVMVESAVGYNAVNEISGYNGSAIAQYGAEKQWLVHDDTLVHAANSAQYALGVNLSAVAQLLGGIDETVLYDGESSGGTLYNNRIPLTESYKNFNTIKIMNGHYSVGEFPSHLLSGHQDAKITIGFQDANTAQPLTYGLLRYSATNDTTMIQYFNRVVAFSTANALTVQTNVSNYNTRTYKVIGVGRKY